MKVIRRNIAREEVIRFYVEYDRRKKHKPALVGLAHWPWDDPVGLDRKLMEHELKSGVVAAYKVWWFVELSLPDLLECAIVKGVFKDQSQALSVLVHRGVVEAWQPKNSPEWFDPISRGHALGSEWAMILRPSTTTEQPAKWYIEDGTGRALCLVQRTLRHVECQATAFAYLGVIPDERSQFIRCRPELAGTLGRPAI